MQAEANQDTNQKSLEEGAMVEQHVSVDALYSSKEDGGDDDDAEKEEEEERVRMPALYVALVLSFCAVALCQFLPVDHVFCCASS